MLDLISRGFLKVIGGTRNERVVRRFMGFVTQQVNHLEADLRQLSDAELTARVANIRTRLAEGQPRQAARPEVFAIVREASRRARNHRQFDVQLAAGRVLDEGWIVEEATGEGKTIACYPAMAMAVLEGMKVHLVTTNDYLVQVGADFAKPVFEMLGMTVGFITNDMPAYGPEAEVRRAAYACDITYGTAAQFGFDYLRDNMKTSLAEQVQGRLDYAIIDEVDNILIDEARTPLIISGLAHGETGRYLQADAVARELLRRNAPYEQEESRVESLKREIKALEGQAAKESDGEGVRAKLAKAQSDLAESEARLAGLTKHYEIEMDRKAVHTTHEGVGAAQEVASVGSFYVGSNIEWPHLVEQALRAHLVYQRDRDYVVQDGGVVIVDEFTGRLLAGRQWSDGLHQAVEAKERVQIKRETQTEATITLQNFFKLYRKLAGMTGTAMTEANEFMKIFKLDVVAVPTHRPVNRVDHNDLIYADVDAKYNALVEEIHEICETGRPVLVGTTSIEKSERISQMLTRRYGIIHSVLNARPENAGREADIVADAGQQHVLKAGSDKMVGNVTIATNMAGRGTDIKLGPGVVWGNCKVLPADMLEKMGIEVEDLFPPGTTKCCIFCPQYDPSTKCAHCYKPKIDSEFPDRGRMQCTLRVPCGLHIVGTERHEARRIDNQLRGRSGRQGDPGSSRFFLSIRDDLMSIFAGEWTVKVLGWLGLTGETAIEDRRISKGVEKAQKKVEQRNFEIRKNLLEYDEVMDYQRRVFYARRQEVLASQDLSEMVWAMISSTVETAVQEYLDGRYAQRCIAEWARQTLQLPVEDDGIQAAGPEDLDRLEEQLRTKAKEEAASVIAMTLGEYIGEDIPEKEWDLAGLSSWAMSRFGVSLSKTRLREIDEHQVETELLEAATERIEAMDLSSVGKYLGPDFARTSLAEWAGNKFGTAVAPAALGETTDEATEVLLKAAEAAYREREISCPVDYALEMTVGRAGGTDNIYAMNELAAWANRKYSAGWNGEQLAGKKAAELRRQLIELSQQWSDEDKLRGEVVNAIGRDPQPAAAVQYAKERFDTELGEAELNGDALGRVVEAGMRFLRREMTELERFVLLQIHDTGWREHLLAMDHLKSSIGLRGYAEQDPRVAYKREGSRMFGEMLEGVDAKVTEMIYRVRLATGLGQSSVYQVSNLVHEQLAGYDHLAQGMAERPITTDEPVKPKTILRDVPKVGRNDPCPCGSGKKYKKCCGKATQ